MKKISCHWIVILFFMLLISTEIFGQVKVYEKFDDFNSQVIEEFNPDSTYVVNFWATWCAPCVKELPYFEALNDKYSKASFKQILVSLDSPRKIESKLIPFIESRELKSEVVLLADGKYNDWIDQIDPRWSGAIPITLIFKGDKKLFFEKEFHNMEEIEIELLKLL